MERCPKTPAATRSFTEKDYLIGKLDDDRAGYDVTFYDLDLTLDPDNKKLGGVVNIHFKAKADLSKIRIDLYENLDIAVLRCRDRRSPFHEMTEQ